MGIKEKLPLINSGSKRTRIAGNVVYAILFLGILGTIAAVDAQKYTVKVTSDITLGNYKVTVPVLTTDGMTYPIGGAGDTEGMTMAKFADDEYDPVVLTQISLVYGKDFPKKLDQEYKSLTTNDDGSSALDTGQSIKLWNVGDRKGFMMYGSNSANPNIYEYICPVDIDSSTGTYKAELYADIFAYFPPIDYPVQGYPNESNRTQAINDGINDIIQRIKAVPNN